MRVEIKDRKLTAAEFEDIVNPLVLDLAAWYNAVQDYIISNILDDDSKTPEQMIDEIVGVFR